jgi:Cof subfamily protein (haloacid dehalogenase superfamily)
VIVATGRMYRSARPYVEQAAITTPVICYQGAAVVDPEDDAYLFHRPLELNVARAAIGALVDLGYGPNVYVDDALFVGEHNEWTRRYAAFQRIEIAEVGNLENWLDREPTKIVAVGEPEELPMLRERLEERLGNRVFLTRSLPHLLELGHPSVSKGSGLRFVAERLGLDLAGVVAFGDGENDIELLETAGFAVAIEGSDPALLELAASTCPGPADDGVAVMIEAVLDSLV